MHVPAPYLNTNGTVNWQGLQRRTVGTNFRSFQEAIDFLGTFNSTTSTIRGRKVRGMMTSGIVGFRRYVDTPYLSHSVNVQKIGLCSVISGRQVSSPRFARFSVLQVEGAGVGFSGGNDSGVGSPWSQFRFDSASSKPSHIANNLAMSNLRSRLENEAKLKAREMAMDLSETLADVGKTIDLVARRTAQLGRFIRELRRGNFRSAASQLNAHRRPTSRDVASAWLEYQYAWRPLVLDIYNGVELIKHGLSRPESIATVTRRGTTSLMIDSYFSSNSSYYDSPQVQGSATGYGEVKYRFRVSNPNLDYVNSLTLVNPLYFMWVRIPLSFVFDWVAPVSDWLLGLTAPLGLEFAGGYTSMKTYANYSALVSYKRTGTSSHTTLMLREGQTGYHLQSLFMRRYKHDTWPLTLPYLTFPIRTLNRAASAAALFRVLQRT